MCAHWTANEIGPAREIAAEGEICRRIGESEAQIVCQQRRTGEDQRAASTPIDQSGIDQRIAADNPRDRQVQRQCPACPIIIGRSLLAQAGQYGSGEIGFGHAQVMDDSEIIERPVDRGGEPGIAQAHVLAQEVRIAHPRSNLERFGAVLGEVEQPFGGQVEPGAAKQCAAVEHAIVNCDLALDCDVIPQRAGRNSGNEVRRIEPARQAEQPGAIGNPQRGYALVLAAHEQTPGPARPGTIAAKACSVGIFEASQRRDRPIGSRNHINCEIEIVPIGFGIDQQVKPVTLSQFSVQIDHQPAVGYLHAARYIHTLRPVAGNSGSQSEVLDRQFFDIDIEARKDRPLFFAGEKFRQARQRRAARGETVDLEPVRQPATRVPVHLCAGYREEHALRVRQFHIVEYGGAVEIAIDPPDADVQPVRERPFGYATGKETLADRRVEQKQSAAQQKDQRRRQAKQPFAPASATGFLLPCRRFKRFRVHHQNACPSET